MTDFHCPICNSANLQNHMTVQDYMVSGEQFNLFKCPDCNTLITQPVPADLEKYYESDRYLSHTTSRKSLITFLYKTVRSVQLRRKSAIIREYSPGPKLLDIGCGTGAFLNEMTSQNFETFGVEINPDARASAQQLTQRPIYPTVLDLNNHTFDIITYWHVLEHLSDPVQSVIQASQMINAEGIMLVAVPNHTSYDANHYSKFWAGYDVPRHLFHFSPDSMKRIALSSGLNLISILPMKFDSFYVSLLSEEYLGTGIVRHVKAFMNGLISNIKARSSGNYSSLIYIFKKNA